MSSVEELALSQEGQPQTHCSMCQICREINLHWSSMFHIIHNDLSLKCVKKRHTEELTQSNRSLRLQHARKPLKMFPYDEVNFTNERMFTVATLKNPQNDHLYIPAATKKKQVTADVFFAHGTTFTQSVMVSASISKLGYTNLNFVHPGTKVSGAYYCDILRHKSCCQ